MLQHWPIRRLRRYNSPWTALQRSLLGQRVPRYLLPLAKGGAAAIPGGLAGKTVTSIVPRNGQTHKW